MSKQILRALPELVQAHIISEETAEQIRRYYGDQPNKSSNRLFIVFGILGALLVAMGIVLIIAHNWDILPKEAKLFIGCAPMIAGQCLTGYIVFKKIESRAWREGAAVFLFLSVAVAIAIVSQVYNIEGTLAGFLITWMWLVLPIAYILRSSMASMMFIIGITWYACETGYFNYPHAPSSMYWLLFALILPFYYMEFLRFDLKNNYYYFHSWLLAGSVTIALGTFAHYGGELMMIAYMSLFSGFVILGEMERFSTNRILTNAFLVVGSLGVMSLLLALSFEFYWDEVVDFMSDDRNGRFWEQQNVFLEAEMIASVVTTLLTGLLLIIQLRSTRIIDVNSKSFAFILFILLFFVGITAPKISQILVNLIILFFAVHTIRSGAQKNHLGILNYGILIITTLIICRFFDTDLSFVIRGLMFIAVGAGFFAANYYMIRKRKGAA